MENGEVTVGERPLTPTPPPQRRAAGGGDMGAMLQVLHPHNLRARCEPLAQDDSVLQESVRRLAPFLIDRGMPTDVANITGACRDVDNAAIGSARRTAAHATGSVQQFFRWLVEEGRPLDRLHDRMRPPSCPRNPRRCCRRTTGAVADRLRE